MSNFNKNPIPFNPQANLTGSETRDALEILKDIFHAVEQGRDDSDIVNLVFSKFDQMHRVMK